MNAEMTIDAFFDRARDFERFSMLPRRAFVEHPDFDELYLKLSSICLEPYNDKRKMDPVIIISRIMSKAPGTGAFVRFIKQIQAALPTFAIEIECVQSPKFSDHLSHHGWRVRDVNCFVIGPGERPYEQEPVAPAPLKPLPEHYRVFTALVAVDEAMGIGKNGTIPWRNKADMERFRHVTQGGLLIMGRKTWESIPVALGNRKCVVVSRGSALNPIPGRMVVAPALETALTTAVDYAIPSSRLFVIGGGEIYRQCFELGAVSALTITRIGGNHDCDVTFQMPGNFLLDSGYAIDSSKDCSKAKLETYVYAPPHPKT